MFVILLPVLLESDTAYAPVVESYKFALSRFCVRILAFCVWGQITSVLPRGCLRQTGWHLLTGFSPTVEGSQTCALSRLSPVVQVDNMCSF